MEASILSAPSSAKNISGVRDPEIQQATKGGAWHFGMKVQVGVDDPLGLIHSVGANPVNEADNCVAEKLLHSEERLVWADVGHQGIDKRDEHWERKVDWFIALRLGKRSAFPKQWPWHKIEKIKANLGAKVAHVVRCIKQMFNCAGVCDCGLWLRTRVGCICWQDSLTFWGQSVICPRRGSMPVFRKSAENG